MRNKVQEIITKCQDVAEIFYQNKAAEGFAIFCTLIEDIQELTEDMQQGEALLENNAAVLPRLNEALAEALDAMEVQDMVLLADILKYDVAELLEQIEE